MKSYWMIALVALTVAAFASPAHADILSLNAQLQGGAAGGLGVAGLERMDGTEVDVFHDGARGGGYGVVVGGEFMLVDGWIEHNQFRRRKGLVGTWTQFMVGLDANFGLGERPTIKGDDGEMKKGEAKGYAELGLAVGFGVGTGQQIDPPLDNSEVTDKGFLGQVSIGVGYRMSRVFSLGLRFPIQYGYMFKNGLANNEDNQYQSVQAAALVNLRIDFRLK